ncbi:iron-containing alcohol dehydrogenase [Candidatus Kaiserbacteria bacterium]|nr:iron-containing alcohol dehydrogenase [Candidatus Kaiserbacteria bacterium]
MAQTEYIGEGALGNIRSVVAAYAPQKIFLVTGKGSYTASGAAQGVAEATTGLAVLHHTDFGALPLQEDIEKGIAAYTAFGPDLVIAVGGGHVIDMAKAINFYTGKKPLIAIPTTAGSGSEATQFAVVYKDGLKTSLESPDILPTVAIVDPALARSVPHDIALASGLDALAQSIESLWSVQATAESKKYAQEALALVWKNSIPAIETGSAPAIAAMVQGAHLAGKAINISKTTACHALSYGLTYRFGVPHGLAVAVFLPALFRHNAFVSPEQSVTPEALEQLLVTLKVKRLSGWGIQESDIAQLAKEVNIERLGNNPAPVTKEDIIRFYTQAL